MNKCIGCGALLQDKDKNSLGYIPKEKYNDKKLCERCFRLLHYNDLKVVDLPENKDVLKSVNESHKFVFFLCDLLNINSEVMATYNSLDNPKCLIVSKIDFIPKYINKEKIKEWLKDEYKVNEKIIFLSALKNQNISAISDTMIEENIKEAYLVGYTNSGKSTLVNHLMKTNQITTSLLPNTTIDFIKIKLDNDLTLIDSPGFLYQESIFNKDDVVFIKKINPKTFVKPITYQLKSNASIIIEDKIRIENKSDKCNLTIYMSNLLDIKKVYEKNDSLTNLNKKSLKVLKNQDIVIKGLGFINVKSNANINIYMENPNLVELRDSFFER
jgi:hypothetical protein